MRTQSILYIISTLVILCGCNNKNSSEVKSRKVELFNNEWKFNLGDESDAFKEDFDDSSWRALNLPHDWSIEADFSPDYPATPGGGALLGGIGWYRKTFIPVSEDKNKNIYIDFDGIYWNSEVWINGHLLGKRPNGYISFRHDITPFIKFKKKTV